MLEDSLGQDEGKDGFSREVPSLKRPQILQKSVKFYAKEREKPSKGSYLE